MSSLLILRLGSLSADAAATASVLSIVSPPQYAAVASPTQVAVDDAGRVMIAYKGRGPDKKLKLYSTLRAGATWQHYEIPMPDITQYFENLRLRGLAAGRPEHGFHLAGSYYGTIYYWHWHNGQWSQPETIAERIGGLAAVGVALDPQAAPVIVWNTTRFHYVRRQGGRWQDTPLPYAVAQRDLVPVFTQSSGLPHLLGERRSVPIVVSLAAGADPSVAGNWVAAPGPQVEAPTSAVPYPATGSQFVLDWPHQLVFAAWQQKGHLYVAWGPVGATTAGQWRTAEIPLPEKAAMIDYQLASNGRGGTGLLVNVLTPGQRTLTFHWLGPNGPGGPIPILRPGTQTEAAVFERIETEGMNFCVDAQGTAHLAIVATKRGETPAHMSRLYYATVTGGGTASEGPQVAGGGTTTMEREGPPPDFVARIVDPGPEDDPLRIGTGRLRPRIEIRNQGAEYYGDLTFELDVDGGNLRVRVPDESNHRLPLFRRDESRSFVLPEVTYEATYRLDPQPPTMTLQYGQQQNRMRLGTGLGRKRMVVNVDPDNAIEEADEANNSAEAEYLVTDGRSELDRERVGNRLVYGLNDLGLLQPPRLRSNTQLLRAGYVQRPTQLDVLVGNPRLAGFFLNPEVVVLLDDTEVARQTIPVLDRQPNLVSDYLGTAIIYDRVPRRPDISGAMFHIPVDLTQVPEGEHTLRVQVDPDDKFGDRKRDNNEAVLNFRVRPPGGTLQVRITDLTQPNAPVARALVTLQDLWAQRADDAGLVTIPDVPPGQYNGRSLSAERLDEEPRYFLGFAQPFSVASNQVTQVRIELERPLTVVGSIRKAGTQELVTDEYVEVFIRDEDEFLPGRANGGQYTIPNVSPGRHMIVCGAYGYQTRETQAAVQRPDRTTDQCRIDLELVDGPRGTVVGQVLDRSNRAIPGAVVWLEGAPRSAQTDANGAYRFDRVAARNEEYVVWAEARDYATDSVRTGVVQAGQTCSVAAIHLPRITRRFKTIDFDATTLAICEESPDAGDIPSFRVETNFGAFKGALGLMYHATENQVSATVDHILIWLEGGPLVQGGVHTSVGVDRLTGVELDTLSVGPMNDLLTGFGRTFQVISGINKLADWLAGDIDPSQLHRNNEVTANYVSHTGAEYRQDPFINVPTSTDVPLAVTFQGGGQTIVRVDRIILHDGANPDKTIVAEWYSPGFAAFRVGQNFNVDSLEVKLLVAVLNSRLQSGILGNSSRNMILWKPGQENWLRISGFNYELTWE